jgi:RNA polymerase sigma-70 factor (ECF subfamily)
VNVSSADVPDHRALWIAGTEREEPAPATAQLADASRLRTLFALHYAFVWRFLRHFGVQTPQLEDAAQEVFWVMARRLSDVRPGCERAFLYGIAIRIAAEEVRRRLRSPRVETDPDEVLRLVDPGPSPEQQVEQRQRRELLDAILDRMPLELRTVFVLAELEGMEVRDIAELERIPLGTASSRLRRARQDFSAAAKRMRVALAARGAKL